MLRSSPRVSLCVAILIATTVRANELVLNYEPNPGNLSIDALGEPLTTVQIQTASPIFTGTRPANLNNFFDVFDPFKIFKLDPVGFDTLDFGSVIEPATTAQRLADQFCVSGSLQAGGPITAASLMADQESFPVEVSATCPSPPTVSSRPIHFEYNVATGNLQGSVRGAPNDPAYTIMALRANRDLFVGKKPNSAAGFSDRAIVAIGSDGITDFRFGEILEPGLDASAIAESVCLTAKSIDASSPRQSAHTINGHPLKTCGSIENADHEFGTAEVMLRYDPVTGSLAVHSPSIPIHLMFVQANTPIIKPENADPDVFADPFDLINDSLIRFSEQFGVDGANFGNVLPPGLTQEQIESEISITGRFIGGAFIEPVWVPEPNTRAAAGGFLAPLIFVARRTRHRFQA